MSVACVNESKPRSMTGVGRPKEPFMSQSLICRPQIQGKQARAAGRLAGSAVRKGVARLGGRRVAALAGTVAEKLVTALLDGPCVVYATPRRTR